MDDQNDIRLALGTLVNRCQSIEDKIDDIGAFITKIGALAEYLTYVEQLLDELPGLIDKAAVTIDSHPMLGTLLGPVLGPVLGELKAGHEKRRHGQGPPPIESTTG